MFKTNKLLLFTTLLVSLLLVAACGVAPTGTGSEGGDHHNEEHAAEHDGEHGHDGDHPDRIPNEGGAAIKIITPEDGLQLKVGTDIKVEVEIDNFELSQDGSHWHVYVNGTSHGMVTGVDYDQVVRGLEPGTHEIEAYLAKGTHEEFQEGAKVTISIVE